MAEHQFSIPMRIWIGIEAAARTLNELFIKQFRNSSSLEDFAISACWYARAGLLFFVVGALYYSPPFQFFMNGTYFSEAPMGRFYLCAAGATICVFLFISVPHHILVTTEATIVYSFTEVGLNKGAIEQKIREILKANPEANIKEYSAVMNIIVRSQRRNPPKPQEPPKSEPRPKGHVHLDVDFDAPNPPRK